MRRVIIPLIVVISIRFVPDGEEATITATAQWRFEWSALGYSGTLPGEATATRTETVGELQSVIINVDPDDDDTND